MLASQDNLPGRTLIGIKVWSKGIFKSLKTALMFATAKNNHSLNKGDDAFAIISFYTSLYKKGEVSWRWLLERLAFVGDDRIQYDNGVLPAVLEREFLEVQKILSEGGDLSTLKCEEARRELVQFKYITQSKYVLFMRANELLEKLNLEEAFFCCDPKRRQLERELRGKIIQSVRSSQSCPRWCSRGLKASVRQSRLQSDPLSYPARA